VDSTRRSEQFTESVIANQRRLYAYILTLLPDPNDASDVLQQTNMALWRESGSFEEGTDFVAWSLRVAYYRVLEHRTKQKRQRKRFSTVLVETLADEMQSESSDENHRLEAMLKCLEHLRPRDRELVYRRYSKGEMVSAMAASMGQSANALANQLYRIRRSLWKCIQSRLSSGNEP